MNAFTGNERVTLGGEQRLLVMAPRTRGDSALARRVRRALNVVLPLLVAALLAGAGWNLGQAGYLHAKAWLAQRLIDRAWSQDEGPARPWPWADMRPVARLAAPRIHQALYVLSDASDRSLAFGPGVWQGDPARTGESVVLAGHRDTHFALLQQLVVGDTLTLALPNGAVHRYRVRAMHVIDTRDQSLVLTPESGELILATCYPFDAINPGGPLRYIVVAEPEVAAPATPATVL